MSILAWRILAILVAHAQEGDWSGRYMAGWTLRERLGQSAPIIEAACVQHGIGNEYERALHELVVLGIVEEVPNLGERWQLVVKYPEV